MTATSKADLFRRLPSVDELLRRPAIAQLMERHGRAVVADATRQFLDGLRTEISSEPTNESVLDSFLENALSRIEDAIETLISDSLRFSLRSVINATGVILHTNLGRAPLAQSAFAHIQEAAEGYSNLEFDIGKGERGKRDVHADRLFKRLLNVRSDVSTIVVNNNAAAVLLALNTLAEGGEVIVSRGELVEIGGSFRIPDVMTKSNAVLREVGTTNRTRIADYEKAITDKTRLLLRVHRSNFQISGFTEQPGLDELVALSKQRQIPLIEDLGSGALLDLNSVGISGETGVLDSLRAGVDVVSYSGDKLLGGPQAGILSGRSDLIGKMRSNSLFRALRVDKLTYAALEATLVEYLKGNYDAIPALRMMRLPKTEVERRAKAVASVAQTDRLSVELIGGESVVGGGAAPSAVLPTCLLAVSCEGFSADQLAALLRTRFAIIGRVEESRVWLDLRTVFPEQDERIVQALKAIAAAS